MVALLRAGMRFDWAMFQVTDSEREYTTTTIIISASANRTGG